MPSLAQMLATKLANSGLTATKAAKQAGISFFSFRSALMGKSAPNNRSVDKYAKLLGISAGEVFAAAGKSGKKALKTTIGAKVSQKARKKTAGAARRGRPPGSKNKVKKGAAGHASALAAALTQAVGLLKQVAKGLRALK
jgi:hypothetical protein